MDYDESNTFRLVSTVIITVRKQYNMRLYLPIEIIATIATIFVLYFISFLISRSHNFLILIIKQLCDVISRPFNPFREIIFQS